MKAISTESYFENTLFSWPIKCRHVHNPWDFFQETLDVLKFSPFPFRFDFVIGAVTKQKKM